MRPLIPMFPDAAHPDVLVGLGTADDAAVVRLPGGRVAVTTVDFFPPVVDDAYEYGAVAAANALSDVWAMGATPALAVNIALFPADMPVNVSQRILVGAAERVRDAGAVVAGGHTMDNKDPVFGLAVVGFGDEAALMTKGGARPGDALVLTKPLGSGLLTTAGKRGLLGRAEHDAVVRVMTRLNGPAAAMAARHGVRAATDVTGFGLLGHLIEMADGAGVTVELDARAIPLLPGVPEFAARDTFAGGAYRNWEHAAPRVRFARETAEAERMVLADPQTSGGLLLAVDAARASALVRALRPSDPEAAVIGRVRTRATPQPGAAGEIAVEVV